MKSVSIYSMIFKLSCGEGGVRDFYGEDLASEDQNVTPWRTSVAW